MTHRVTVKVAGLQPVQVLAALAGIAFIVFGVVGFSRTGVGDWATHSFVLGFSVNPLHNLVLVAAGVLGLLMALGSGLARLYGWLMFVGCAAIFVWGLMITGILARNPASQFGNPLALNTNDNWLYLGLALFGLLLAVLPARRKVIEEEEEPELPQQRSAAFRGVRDEPDREPRIEEMDPTVSPREREPVTKEQAVVDPKTDRVSKDKIKH
ncbi:DUF4383 domain-containing protein [Lentzea flava]|uniref:DUF4383 domain-containing protein n=1 Tax=Lentzea flava TaxID=103732 RepID=A0ABQ2UYK6_9PSEU|nr:DUF4383 domain-containing protein [Lentzea flava]MCP2202555.1 protein of unknown function (DUF4383) [Lentzea flava]GGU60436.1 hypothetical protein GCM10010178_60780 [Lentzea flava]